MATQALSPELLKILEGLGQTGGYADPASGMYYQGTFSGQGGGDDTGYLTGYTASGGDVSKPGARADTFGTDGKYTGNIDAYSDPNDKSTSFGTFLKYLAIAASAGAGASALAGGSAPGAGGAGAAAGGGAAGPGMAGWGADLGMAGTAGTGSGMGTTLAGTAGGGLSAVTPSAGGSLLDGIKNLVPSAAKDYLGPAATIAGGLLGAKGNEATTTSTKSLDPRMDPLVYGQGGLSSKIQELLNKQTSKSGLLGKYWS